MCFGGGNGRTVQYESTEPTVIAPPTTTVELDESDIDNATAADDKSKVGRQTLRNDLTTSTLGNSIAGQGLNILGGTASGTSSRKKPV